MATLESRIAALEREFGITQKVLWFTWEHDESKPVVGVNFEDENHMRREDETEPQFLARFEAMKAEYVRRRKAQPGQGALIAGFYHFLTDRAGVTA